MIAEGNRSGVFYVIEFVLNSKFQNSLKVRGSQTMVYPNQVHAAYDFERLVSFVEDRVPKSFAIRKSKLPNDVVSSVEIRNAEDWVTKIHMSVLDHTNEVKH